MEPSREGGPTSMREVGSFSYRSEAVLVCTGEIGDNAALVRENWPERLGPRPEWMLQGVPAHVGGRMLQIRQRAGARLVNLNRRWHYPEGIANRAPVWPGPGVRLLAGLSSLRRHHWGRRLPAPCFPGFDNLLALETISTGAAGHSWLLLNEGIFRRELVLSGCEQSPDVTSQSWRQVLSRRGAPLPVRQIRELGSDFAVGSTVPELVAALNRLTPESPLDPGRVAEEVRLRDRRLPGGGWADPQLAAVPGRGGERHNLARDGLFRAPIGLARLERCLFWAARGVLDLGEGQVGPSREPVRAALPGPAGLRGPGTAGSGPEAVS